MIEMTDAEIENKLESIDASVASLHEEAHELHAELRRRQNERSDAVATVWELSENNIYILFNRCNDYHCDMIRILTVKEIDKNRHTLDFIDCKYRQDDYEYSARIVSGNMHFSHLKELNETFDVYLMRNYEDILYLYQRIHDLDIDYKNIETLRKEISKVSKLRLES